MPLNLRGPEVLRAIFLALSIVPSSFCTIGGARCHPGFGPRVLLVLLPGPWDLDDVDER